MELRRGVRTLLADLKIDCSVWVNLKLDQSIYHNLVIVPNPSRDRPQSSDPWSTPKPGSMTPRRRAQLKFISSVARRRPSP
jgi:hypothetical protein